jgi:hypothetical protein
MPRMYYVKKPLDPAVIEGRRKLRASDFNEFDAIRWDFNETSDARPLRSWGGRRSP